MNVEEKLIAGATEFFSCYMGGTPIRCQNGTEPDTDTASVWGSVAIQGHPLYHVRILIPEASAIEILNRAMGGNAEHLNPMVLSAVSELLNTIGGAIQRALADAGAQGVELGLPIVHATTDDPHPDPLRNPLCFSTDTQDIRFWASIEIVRP